MMVTNARNRLEFDAIWRYLDTDVANAEILAVAINDLKIYSKDVIYNFTRLAKYLKISLRCLDIEFHHGMRGNICFKQTDCTIIHYILSTLINCKSIRWHLL